MHACRLEAVISCPNRPDTTPFSCGSRVAIIAAIFTAVYGHEPASAGRADESGRQASYCQTLSSRRSRPVAIAICPFHSCPRRWPRTQGLRGMGPDEFIRTRRPPPPGSERHAREWATHPNTDSSSWAFGINPIRQVTRLNIFQNPQRSWRSTMSPKASNTARFLSSTLAGLQ